MLGFFLALPRVAERGAQRTGRLRVRAALRALARTIRATEEIVFTPGFGLAGAFGYLLCDIAVLWACFRALGHAPPIASIVLAYQVGYLANLVPVPGGIGILDGA